MRELTAHKMFLLIFTFIYQSTLRQYERLHEAHWNQTLSFIKIFLQCARSRCEWIIFQLSKLQKPKLDSYTQ